MIRIHRLKATFINVPKTGSTSVREFLIDNVVSSEDTITYHRGITQNVSAGLHSHYTQSNTIKNDLSVSDDTFYATVREPLERTLSLYLYRWKQGEIPTPSIGDFRLRLYKGKGWIQDVKPYQMQLQSNFMNNGTWWCYDTLDSHIKDLIQKYTIEVKVPFGHHNQSSLVPTHKLVDQFYDESTKNLVRSAQQLDFELYERVKNEYRKSSN
jgi:hypothetical protein